MALLLRLPIRRVAIAAAAGAGRVSASAVARRALSSAATAAARRATAVAVAPHAAWAGANVKPSAGALQALGGVRWKKSDKKPDNKNKRAVESTSGYDVAGLKQQMSDVTSWLTNEFNGIRAGGRATAEQLHGINVRAYGNPNTPLTALGTIASRGANALLITPHDPATVKDIIAAIKASGKELAATEDGGAGDAAMGAGILVQFPKSSKEIRDQLLKLAKEKAENARTRIKRLHSDARSQLKRIEGMGKDDIHKIDQSIGKATEDANKAVKQLVDAKEKELAQA